MVSFRRFWLYGVTLLILQGVIGACGVLGIGLGYHHLQGLGCAPWLNWGLTVLGGLAIVVVVSHRIEDWFLDRAFAFPDWLNSYDRKRSFERKQISLHACWAGAGLFALGGRLGELDSIFSVRMLDFLIVTGLVGLVLALVGLRDIVTALRQRYRQVRS